MALGQIIQESGSYLHYLYFPTTSVVSLMQATEDGGSSATAIVGCDGLAGISIFMGSDTSPSRVMVQSSGCGYRIKSAILKREFEYGGKLQLLILRYTQALITQMAQMVICNRYHTLEQQLCRWLLSTLDRLPGNELMITQEMIAGMLGVRREGVSEAAHRLQTDGLIHYRRGHITVLDRPKIEDRVCECYGVVMKEYQNLLGFKSAGQQPAPRSMMP
jgi:CRP-like cAMP-binding protein